MPLHPAIGRAATPTSKYAQMGTMWKWEACPIAKTIDAPLVVWPSGALTRVVSPCCALQEGEPATAERDTIYNRIPVNNLSQPQPQRGASAEVDPREK